MKFKYYKIRDVFTIKLGKNNNKPQLEFSSFGIPYITRSSLKNGLNGFVSNEYLNDKSIEIYDSNCLTIGIEGNTAFYQPVPFFTGTNINILRNENLNVFNSLYLIVVMNKAMSDIFNYGRLATQSRLMDLSIMLPSTDTGDPDWQFMEDYIKQFEETKLLEIQETDYKDNVKLPSVDEWGSYRLSDLFEITLAKPFFLDKTFDQTDISGTPYITRSSFNNGLVNRLNLEIIDNSLKLINAGDCLTVGAEGKKTFYQNNDFIAGNKVTILRNRNISKPSYFFIIVILDMAMKEVFSYGRAATYGRLIDLNINLPSKDGEPDWELIERYMRSLPYSEII